MRVPFASRISHLTSLIISSRLLFFISLCANSCFWCCLSGLLHVTQCWVYSPLTDTVCRFKFLNLSARSFFFWFWGISFWVPRRDLVFLMGFIWRCYLFIVLYKLIKFMIWCMIFRCWRHAIWIWCDVLYCAVLLPNFELSATVLKQIAYIHVWYHK